MAQQAKPNILFIMADDIGWFNASCYNNGIMGYRTPNIDRIAKEAPSSPTSMVSKAAPPAALPTGREAFTSTSAGRCELPLSLRLAPGGVRTPSCRPHQC